MRVVLIFMLVTAARGETLTGRLLDGTRGGDGTAQSLQLILIENSMDVVGTLTDVSGTFTFESDKELSGKRLLLQANKDGVLYSQGIQWPSEEGIVLTVYEAGADVPVQASIGSMALYAYAQSLDIGIFYELENVSDPKTTLLGDAGSFSFDLIHGHTAVEASTRRGTLPLRQELAIEGDRATLRYPLKPGNTQLMVRTRHLYNPNETNVVTLKLPPHQGAMKLLALPLTLTVETPGLEAVNEDAGENMRLYSFTPAEGQQELVLEIKGKPLDKPLESAQPQAQAQAQTRADAAHGANGPKVERRPHPLNAHRNAILIAVSLAFVGLAVFALRR